VDGQTVVCARHGERQATFVCHHLLQGSGTGWFTVESGDEERPDAICSLCDAFWRESGNVWTGEVAAQVQVRVVCAGCYDDLRERHQA
jgi:hypothetical protein